MWGTATAALQIEGSLRSDGAGESSWEHFSRQPGAISDNTTPEVGCDHYRLWRDDISRMKDLGVKAYRFSVPWCRTVPDGKTLNPAALDFYDRLVDELLAKGIEPYVTLFHWETPQALEERGGWLNKDTAYAIEKHAESTLRRLADRVGHFFTINEAMCFSLLGYGSGVHAPGLKLGNKAALQSLHNAYLAHGVLLDVIRKTAPQVKAGIVENTVTAIPVWESPEHCAAAERAFDDLNADRLTLVLQGRYSDAFLKRVGADAPDFTDAELKLIGGKMDMIGLNCYSGCHVADAPELPEQYRVIPFPADYPRMTWDWFGYDPNSLYWSIREINALYPGYEFFITENGCPGTDRPDRDSGRIDDTTRVLFLREYLKSAYRATAEGLPLKGYFCWSLLDNFEWAFGYTTRFGLYYVDWPSQRRIAKLSAGYFREVVRQNALV